MTSPTNPGDPDIVGLVRSLTKAQREAICRMSEKLAAPKKLGLTTQRLLPLMDLWRSKRGVQPPIALVRRDYSDWPRLHWVYALSPLGLRVRQHLLDNPS